MEQRGWSVWWDSAIPTGATYDKAIQAAIKSSPCFIVLWSKAAVDSDWVRAEAAEGHRSCTFLPARLDSVELPVPFNTIQTADLCRWSPDSPNPDFDALVESIKSGLGKPRRRGKTKAARVESGGVAEDHDARQTQAADGAWKIVLRSSAPLRRTFDVHSKFKDGSEKCYTVECVYHRGWFRSKFFIKVGREIAGEKITSETKFGAITAYERYSEFSDSGTVEFPLDKHVSAALDLAVSGNFRLDIVACRLRIEGRVLYREGNVSWYLGS